MLDVRSMDIVTQTLVACKCLDAVDFALTPTLSFAIIVNKYFLKHSVETHHLVDTDIRCFLKYHL